MDAHPFPSFPSCALSNPILGISEASSPFLPPSVSGRLQIASLFGLGELLRNSQSGWWREEKLACFADGGSDMIVHIGLFGKLNSHWRLRGSAPHQ